MLLFLDTETTGLSSKKGANEIIQLGAIISNPRNILESVLIKSRPNNWNCISQEALKVTNLSVSMLKTYPDSKESFDHFYSFLEKYQCMFQLAGQNIAFDTRFLESWWNTWKSPNQKSFHQMFDIKNSYELMHITKKLKELGILIVENIKLGTVANALQIKPSGELHNAMTDIDLTHKTMFDLIDRIKYLKNTDLNYIFKRFIDLG